MNQPVNQSTQLKIREIFYSIQGEGSRQGEASIFIRLAECNLNCWFCDTDWSYGDMLSLHEIHELIKHYKTDWIVWTGGEPTLQLNVGILRWFSLLGYKHAIETNGTNPVPKGIDYICCAPKQEVSLETLHENFGDGVDEFRYPIGFDNYKQLPEIKDLPYAHHYYVSPIFLGEPKKRFKLDKGNVEICLDIVKKDPRWKLSLQIHKIIDVR